MDALRCVLLEFAFKTLLMRMLLTLACGCGSLKGRDVVGDVEEDFGQLPDEDSFTCELIGGTLSPSSQRCVGGV